MPDCLDEFDPLSDILALLRPRAVQTYGLSVGGTWAMESRQCYSGIKFGAVARGTCWFLHGETPVRLEPGDCYLLRGTPYWMGSAPGVPAVAASSIFLDPATRVAQIGTGDDTFVIGSHLTFDESHEVLLTGTLPAAMHIPAQSEEAPLLRSTLDHLTRELVETRPGSALIAEHLGHVLFIGVLRAHMARQGTAAVGWLRGLTDPRIGRTLRAMHADPTRRWTLAVLAQEAGMSRTAFALRFKALVGRPPLDYLLRWRMRLAARALSAGGARLAEVARSAGYESDSAFSAAFKRVMSCPPRQYQVRLSA